MNGDLDRGNLLWEGSRMFLPEHKEALREHRRKQREFRPPKLDEDQLEHIDRTLAQASAGKAWVWITYAGTYAPETVRGTVVRLDGKRKRLILRTEQGTREFAFERILDVEIEGVFPT